MTDTKHIKHWKIVEVQLRQASGFLFEPERFSIPEKELQDYEDYIYIDNNEFELAMDELAEIALEFGCKSSFWRRLKKPALQMELQEKANQYEKCFHEALQRNNV
ncbi:MAG: hypothetical protein K6L60_05110 [Oceanobacter sp.]